jgi:hypothetical protein
MQTALGLAVLQPVNAQKYWRDERKRNNLE